MFLDTVDLFQAPFSMSTTFSDIVLWVGMPTSRLGRLNIHGSCILIGYSCDPSICIGSSYFRLLRQGNQAAGFRMGADKSDAHVGLRCHGTVKVT